jgi:hypothetical protein
MEISNATLEEIQEASRYLDIKNALRKNAFQIKYNATP